MNNEYFERELVKPNCLSCYHFGRTDWYAHCNYHKARVHKDLINDTKCGQHRYIPLVLIDFADFDSMTLESNVFNYRNRLTGNYFSNAEGAANDFSSQEIHDCADKRDLGGDY